MRNASWYIPYWRKSFKKKSRADKPSTGEESRSSEQLEAVRRRWVERYRHTARALLIMGLSVGSNRREVQARYERLRATGQVPRNELEEAHRYLMRVLPAGERRKKRPREDRPPINTVPDGRGAVLEDGGGAPPDTDAAALLPDDEVDDIEEDDENEQDEGIEEEDGSYGSERSTGADARSTDE